LKPHIILGCEKPLSDTKDARRRDKLQFFRNLRKIKQKTKCFFANFIFGKLEKCVFQNLSFC